MVHFGITVNDWKLLTIIRKSSILGPPAVQDPSQKAIILMPKLLPQKLSKIPNSKEYQLLLEQRLDVWKNGEFEDLLFEGKIIQSS